MASSKHFVVPLPLNIANARLHWRSRLKKKKQLWADLDLLQMARKIPAAPRKPWDKTNITVHFYLWNSSDVSNLMARMKFVEDWLVNSGYIVDDSPKHLTYTGLPGQSIDRKNQRLEVTLEKSK